MTRITPQHYAIALDALLAERNADEYVAILTAFVQVLTMDGMISRAEEILSAFQSLCDTRTHTVSAHVVSRTPLSSEMRTDMIAYVKERTTSSAVRLIETIDHDILGGIRLTYEHRILDATIRTRLNTLSHALHA